MISLTRLLTIFIVTVILLRSIKLLIIPSIWINASLRVSEYCDMIALRMDSVESFVVLVILRRFYFDIRPISPDFSILYCWILARQAWWFMPISSGERVWILVFLGNFLVIVVNYSVKYSHRSKSTEFMRGGEKLRVLWSIIQFIIALTYKLLSFVFGSLLFGCSCK